MTQRKMLTFFEHVLLHFWTLSDFMFLSPFGNIDDMMIELNHPKLNQYVLVNN